MPKPLSFYKYQGIKDWSLDSLKSQTIYFSPPDNFNDPYDCAVAPFICALSDQDIGRIREKISSDTATPESVKLELSSINPDTLREVLLQTLNKNLEQAITRFRAMRGISCFSEKNDELLMWAHYADKYKGFCLEFSSNNALFDKAIKVDYSHTIPSLNAENQFEILANNNFEGILEKLFCTKSESWSYEREWRLLHANAGVKYKYPEDCLTGVYFGSEMSRQHMEDVCAMVRRYNKDVKLWKGSRSKTEFKMSFTEY